jgi:hypothetical protein
MSDNRAEQVILRLQTEIDGHREVSDSEGVRLNLPSIRISPNDAEALLLEVEQMRRWKDTVTMWVQTQINIWTLEQTIASNAIKSSATAPARIDWCTAKLNLLHDLLIWLKTQ